MTAELFTANVFSERDGATVFGVDVPDPDPAALADSQQAVQNLQAAARQARAAAAQATSAVQGQYAHQIAAVADAAARGDAAGMKDGVNGALAVVSQHPEVFGTPAAGFANASGTALGQIETAIQAIGQAHDASSAADAIDATANAVESTGKWVVLGAALFSGGGGLVAAGILIIGGFFVALAHGIANLIRSAPSSATTSSSPPATTSTPSGTSQQTSTDPQATDQKSKTAPPTTTAGQQVKTDPPTTGPATGTDLPTGTGTGGGDGSPAGGRFGHHDPSSTQPSGNTILATADLQKKAAPDPG